MNDRGLFKTQSNVIPYRDTDLNAVIEILKDDQNLVLRESLWVIKLSHLPIGDIHVHFVLSQGLLWRNKTNQKFKAVKKLTAVTESLLPFINGPSRLKLVN